MMVHARPRDVFVVIAASALATLSARADTVKPAPEPCVNRVPDGVVRYVRDIELGATTLDYCVGGDCWSLDLAAMVVSNAPKRAPGPVAPRDPAGVLTDGHGTTLATADASHVEFCPRGKPPCRSFKYKVSAPVTEVYPRINEAGTLGAVVCRGEGDNDVPMYLLAFDIAHGKALGRPKGDYIVALDHGFLVDDKTFYDAAAKKVGVIAANDRVWAKLGTTDRIALRDDVNGLFILQDTTTAKVLARIPTGVADKKTFFSLVPTPDGKTVYAIGWFSAEGEVIRIDTTTAKITGRATATVCAAGTRRSD